MTPPRLRWRENWRPFYTAWTQRGCSLRRAITLGRAITSSAQAPWTLSALTGHRFLFEAFPQTFPGKGSSPGGQLGAGHLRPLPYAFGLHWRVCQLRSEIEAKRQSRPGLSLLREMPRSVCSTHEAAWQIIRKHPCSLASSSGRALTTWANLLAIGGRRGAAISDQSIWPAFRKMPTTTRLSGGSGQSPRMQPLELAVARQCGGVSLYQLPGGGALLKQSLPGNAEKKPGAAAPRVATSICVRNPGGFPKGERQSGPDPRNPHCRSRRASCSSPIAQCSGPMARTFAW